MSNSLEVMIGYAREFQKQKPDYFICGSLALIYLGAIKDREVNDYDFVTNRKYFNPALVDTYGNYGPQENIDNIHYKVTVDKTMKGTHYYDVFVYPDEHILNVVEVDGLRFQNPKDILSVKKLWGREKDLIDYDSIPF